MSEYIYGLIARALKIMNIDLNSAVDMDIIVDTEKARIMFNTMDFSEYRRDVEIFTHNDQNFLTIMKHNYYDDGPFKCLKTIAYYPNADKEFLDFRHLQPNECDIESIPFVDTLRSIINREFPIPYEPTIRTVYVINNENVYMVLIGNHQYKRNGFHMVDGYSVVAFNPVTKGYISRDLQNEYLEKVGLHMSGKSLDERIENMEKIHKPSRAKSARK